MRRNTLPGGAVRFALVPTLGLWVVYGPALAVFAWHAVQLLRHSAEVVAFPFQIDYGEAPELNRALLLARGQQIYVDVSTPPYQMANYTLLYPALVSLFVRFTGPEFWPGRSLALVSTLASAGLIGVTLRALGAPWV